MKLKISTIDRLAKFICGDEFKNVFMYRSSSFLTSFFASIDLDYRHDGSTRFYWVKDVLEALNSNPEEAEFFPSKEIKKVIENLLYPDYFYNLPSDAKEKALHLLNELLKPYNLKVEINKNNLGKLLSSNDNFISTAIKKNKVEKTIKFLPSVFDIPDLEPNTNIVSVMMPYLFEFEKVFDSIMESCQENGLPCYRAKDIWSDSKIIQDIFNLIYCSKIVIVDFSKRNPNVMYETGIAHTLGKIVIPITQSLDDIPFDLQQHRTLVYLLNNEGLTNLTTELSKRIKTIIDGFKLL